LRADAAKLGLYVAAQLGANIGEWRRGVARYLLEYRNAPIDIVQFAHRHFPIL
jgi:hypothetical protein